MTTPHSSAVGGSPPSPLLNTLNAGNLNKAGGRQNIEEVGTEFESVFLSMMLKEMRNSLEGGFFGEEGSDTYGGMFDLFIGKHLAQSKPLGIGDMLLEQYDKMSALTPQPNDMTSDGAQANQIEPRSTEPPSSKPIELRQPSIGAAGYSPDFSKDLGGAAVSVPTSFTA